MNIKFSYLYRDASNYKKYSDVIFSNPNKISLQEIEVRVKRNLIEGCWFVAKKWNLPDLHLKEFIWDAEIDHDWHEFESVEETEQEATSIIMIDELLIQVELLTNRLYR